MSRPQVFLGERWSLPQPDVVTLNNGLTLWSFAMPGQHIATFDLVLPAPLAAEPAAKEGVGSVALHAIDEGTRTHPDGRIGELLELQGASLHGAARHRYTTFGGQAPARRLHPVLGLFVEILSEPAYTEADVAHHVEAQVAAYRTRLASPAAATQLAMRDALFGPEHRDGRPSSGTPHTLDAIAADDARAWHAAHFTPGGATLIVAGAHDLDDVVRAVDPWHSTPPTRTAAEISPRQAPRAVVFDRPDAVQASIQVAARTVTRSDPRWPALRVAGHALAGAFASRLNLELRERLGYTYGVHGGFTPGVAEGQFSVGCSVRTEVAGDAVARLLAGIGLADPFTEPEIDDARRFLVGVAPLANETSADVVAQASALAAAGLTPGYLDRHFDDLAKVTAEDADAAYRALIAPEALTVVAAGPAAYLVGQLQAAGLSPEVLELG